MRTETECVRTWRLPAVCARRPPPLAVQGPGAWLPGSRTWVTLVVLSSRPSVVSATCTADKDVDARARPPGYNLPPLLASRVTLAQVLRPFLLGH